MPRRIIFATVVFLAAGCAHRVIPSDHAGMPSSGPPSESKAPATFSAPVSRVTVPGEPFTRAVPDKPFEPALVVTTQVAHADLFYAALLGAGPGYRQATRLYRGQRAFILPLAGNYAVARDGRTDLTFELSLTKADGTRDGAKIYGPLHQEKVADSRQLLFPASVITYFAEAGDPAGEYRFTVHIQDNLGGENIVLDHKFTVADYTPPPVAPGFEAENWVQSYYLNPDPALALPVVAPLFAKLSAARRNTALPAIIGFYDQVLSDNTWLLPAFFTRLAAAEPDEAYGLSIILGFHLRAATTPPAACPPEVWQRLETFRSYTWPNPDAPLTEASQLDCLWGRFYASGLYAPVSRLLEPLENHADLGAGARYNSSRAGATESADDSAAEPAATPPAVLREQILRAALWSLGDNAKLHPLVRAYLEITLRNGKLAETPRALLTRLITPAAPENNAAAPASTAAPAAPEKP